MGLPDKHDDRRFRHFAKMHDDGTVAASVEVADGMAAPVDSAGSVFLEVTDAYPYDFAQAVVETAALATAKTLSFDTATAIANDLALNDAKGKALPIDAQPVDVTDIRALADERDATLRTVAQLLIAQNAVVRRG